MKIFNLMTNQYNNKQTYILNTGPKDAEYMQPAGQTESVLTHIQEFPPRVNRRLLPALDRRYTVTLRTTGRPLHVIPTKLVFQ